MPALLRRYGVLLLLLVLVASLPLALPSNYHVRIATLVWISALVVMGLNLLMGYAGQVSLGHAGFFGIGAYAVAILPAHLGVPPLLAFLLGVAAAGLLAFVVGRPILRLKGYYLAVATLGFGILVAMVLQNEMVWTGGPDGMTVPRLELMGVRLRSPMTWYWISGGTLLLGMLLAIHLIESPTGRALRAIHDSEIAARVAGIDAPQAKLAAFVISAVYAAVGGGLLAWVNGLVTPDMAGFLHSIELVAMAVLGGLGSLLGSVLGAAVLVLLPQLLTLFHEYEQLVLGLVMMLAMIFLRAGIVPSIAARLGWRAA
ncbi:branched-chain amino acid ABC transporter permease [Benzoatithermus flavus]|uniref:Branched-chain amino acid ABC transporter permease n=1 Tax=Benzoatithermus flavus TaxID=3108223 RepID=A0ABU8XUI6_9PROT